MPDDDQCPESPPDPADLEDGETEPASFVVESADSSASPDATVPPPSIRETGDEVGSDTVAIVSAPLSGSDNPVLRRYEKDVHDTIVELRRIETDIRTMLQDRDPVRKRRLTGTARWQELEDDLLRWRFGGRFEEDTLRRAQELIGRRHYLFRRLRYLSSTRPVWNS